MSDNPRTHNEDDPIARALARKRKQRTLKQSDYQDMQQMISEAIRQHEEQAHQQQREVA
jgi:hypothetical protein